MKFQVTQPFSVTVNGRRNEYRLGQRISEAQYNRLSRRHQSRFLSARQAARRNPYTRDEVACIVKAYLDNDHRTQVKNKFFEVYPDSLHTADSIMFQACLLENLDNTRPGQSGTYHITDLVVQVAQEINPDRFVPNLDTQLDDLLADIRG